jgi:hypothetical protein
MCVDGLVSTTNGPADAPRLKPGLLIGADSSREFHFGARPETGPRVPCVFQVPQRTAALVKS